MKPLNERISRQLPEAIERLRSVVESILNDPDITRLEFELVKKEIFRDVLSYSDFDTVGLSKEEKNQVAVHLRSELAHIITETMYNMTVGQDSHLN